MKHVLHGFAAAPSRRMPAFAEVLPWLMAVAQRGAPLPLDTAGAQMRGSLT